MLSRPAIRRHAPWALLAALVLPPPAFADCVDDAAAFHRVNAAVLRAILWNESRMQAGAVHRNRDGSLDVGIGQINSRHFPELRRAGLTPPMLADACVGSYVAAWHLARQVARFGNTWRAIGAYHSLTPRFNEAYANGVAATLASWNLLPRNDWPFPAAARSAAAARRAGRLDRPGSASPGATHGTSAPVIVHRP